MQESLVQEEDGVRKWLTGLVVLSVPAAVVAILVPEDTWGRPVGRNDWRLGAINQAE